MASNAVVFGVLAAGAAGVAALLLSQRKSEGDATGATPAFGGADGGAGSAGNAGGGWWGDGGTYPDPFNPDPAASDAQGGGGLLSPEGEQQFLNDNKDANDRLLDMANQDAAANQDARDRAERQGDIQTLATVAGAAIFAAPTLVRGASAIAGGLRSVAGGAGRSLATVGSRSLAAIRAPTLTAGSAAGAVAAGVGLGLAATYGLEKSGALNQVAKAGDAIGSIIGSNRQVVGDALSTVTAPLQYIGAVATGLVGRGSVGSNVQSVNDAIGRNIGRAGNIIASGGRGLVRGIMSVRLF